MEKQSGNNRSHCIRYEIPPSILVPSHIRLRYQEHRNEFDDLVHGSKPHTRKNTERKKTNRWLNPLLHCPFEAEEAEPCRNAESVRMNELIVFEHIGNDPEAVKDRLRSMEEES